MKKVILLGLLLNNFLTIINAQTNVYHPFPDSNAIWTIIAGNNCTSWSSFIKYQYKISGDTILNSTNYIKISRLIDNNLYPNAEGCGLHIGYLAAIRDDSLNKKVYVIPKDSLQELLLYDFNLNVGDSLISYYTQIYQCQSNALYVETIDSILVNNNYRKRMGFCNYASPPCSIEIHDRSYYIIEGIGSAWGLFDNFLFHYDCGRSYLTCYSENDHILYGYDIINTDTTTNLDAYSCDLSSSVTVSINQSFNNYEIKIFPNPATSEIIISGCIPAYMKLCNTLGQTAAEANKTNKQTLCWQFAAGFVCVAIV